MLEVFTAPPVAPEHVLNPSCKTCSKCTICLEQGGQTFIERMQTEAFKAHIWRIPNKEGGYQYRIEYIVDPQANPLPDNYQLSYMRHLTLRKAFNVLEHAAQEEFTQRLTQGLIKGYWQVVPEKEALELRKLPGPGIEVGHYLPANFVLKTQGTT